MRLHAIHFSRTLFYFEILLKFNIKYARMSEAIRTFQTLYSDSKISLIIQKVNISYVLKKCMFIFIKHLIVTKAK